MKNLLISAAHSLTGFTWIFFFFHSSHTNTKNFTTRLDTREPPPGRVEKEFTYTTRDREKISFYFFFVEKIVFFFTSRLFLDDDRIKEEKREKCFFFFFSKFNKFFFHEKVFPLWCDNFFISFKYQQVSLIIIYIYFLFTFFLCDWKKNYIYAN